MELRLGEFGYAENVGAFNGWLHGAFGAELPTWNEGQLNGRYRLQTPNQPNTAVRTTSLADWERIVTQLAVRGDFNAERCFYTVTGIRKTGNAAALSPTDGVFTLDAGQSYELSLYHFHPTHAPENVILELQLAGGGLEFTTNPVLRIDSRYDQKRVRFQTPTSSSTRTAFLTLVRGTEGADQR